MKTTILTIALLLTFTLSKSQEICEDGLHGIISYQNGKYARAIDYFEKAIKAEPTNAEFYNYLGQTYFALQMYQKAIPQFEKANEYKRKSVDFELAQLYALTRQFTKAIEHLENYLRNGDKQYYSQVFDDKHFNQLRQTEEWTDLWERSHYTKSDYELENIWYSIQSHMYEEALAQLDRIISERKTPHKALYYRAESYFATGLYKDALTDINTALDIRKKNTDYLELRCQIYQKLGKYKKAKLDNQILLKLNPYNLSYYKTEIQLAFSDKNYSMALDKIIFYQKFVPNDNDIQLIKAKILAEQKDYYTALKCYNTLLEKDQSNPLYFIERAQVYANTKTYDRAENDFAMALDLDSLSPETYFLRGNMRLEMGNTKGACYDWKKAASMRYRPAVEKLNKHCID